MRSRCFLALAGMMILVGLAAGGCARAGSAPAARLHHLVLFKLNDPADADALLADCRAVAGEVPGVVSSFTGRPAAIERPPVDRDWDVALCLAFASEANYAAYVDHPAHRALVARWGPRLVWVRAHDVVP